MILKFKERVGVHIQDLVFTRNARTRQQIISMSGKQEKNPNEDAMEQARSKMDDNPEWSKSGDNFLSGDTSQRLNAAVVQGSGLASSGTSAVAIEDVKRFALEVEDEMQVKADQGKGGSASVAPADPSGMSGDDHINPAALWFTRDSMIGKALGEHKAMVGKVKTALTAVRAYGVRVLGEITESIWQDCQVDATILETRLTTVSVVLGEASPSPFTIPGKTEHLRRIPLRHLMYFLMG